MSLTSVLTEIRLERTKQEEKWGEQNHHPDKWMVILMEEVGEASAECREAHPFKNPITEEEYILRLLNYRKELIQVAAVAVAAIESLDMDLYDR